MSGRGIEISLADPGVPADADAYESPEADAVPVQESRAASTGGSGTSGQYVPVASSHAAHVQAAQLAVQAQAQVELAQATNTYDETAEIRRENEERLEEVHAQAEADAQQRADEQKREKEEEQARADEEAHQREEHDREEQEQKDRDEQEAADHAAQAGADAPVHDG